MNPKQVLIDEWFPIGEISIESVRERSAFTALPAHYALHTWFARRPLTTSRAAILYSLINSNDQMTVRRILGLPNNIDVVKAYDQIEAAKSAGQKTKGFTWNRAFLYTPTNNDTNWIQDISKSVWGKNVTILDPMAGGGSIPLESIRLGLNTIAGDLNPVAYIILKGTLEYPSKYKNEIVEKIDQIFKDINVNVTKRLANLYPKSSGEEIYAYIWARTVVCNNCSLVIPLSPNWWIVRGGIVEKEVAVKLILPDSNVSQSCSFELIQNPKKAKYNPNQGTDARKEAICPRCGVVNSSDYVKKEAQLGRMGHQLYAVATKKKSLGRKRGEWVFRTPKPEEYDAIEKAVLLLNNSKSGWEKKGIYPTEPIEDGWVTRQIYNYGNYKWVDIYNPRQLVAHLTYLEEIINQKNKLLSEAKYEQEKALAKAVITYLGIAFDSCVSYNNILTRWRADRKVITGSMDMQAFPFKTSYAEFDHSGQLWNWATGKTTSTVKQIVSYLPEKTGNISLFCEDSANLSLESNSIECIIVDPPYHANVPYAEVSDFFYIWLKRIVGDLYPSEFQNILTNKEDEAVANIALYRDAGKGIARKLASQHYEAKMEACFREMNRVLRDDGVLTVMFTHRESEAWASLATALINAGFTFKSSWPVYTEPDQKFTKFNKGVLKATILLSCRKRHGEKNGLWERVIQELKEIAKQKVKEHSSVGISGPDLLVSVYAPVLGQFANYRVVKDSSGNIKSPTDALNIVAETVNKHLTADLPVSDLETLAYLNLIREFPSLETDYDIARLTTLFGGNITIDDFDVRGGRGLVNKKAGKVKILTSRSRIENGQISPSNIERLISLIDVVHASLHVYERQGLTSVTELLRQTGRDTSDSGYIECLRVISQSGTNKGASSIMQTEANNASSLLEALGYSQEVTRKKGESMRDYI